jgi:hypothetical protein
MNFSAIPVSISPVSLTTKQTWKKFKQQEKIAKNSKCAGREKLSEKRDISCFCLCSSLFGEMFPTAEF